MLKELGSGRDEVRRFRRLWLFGTANLKRFSRKWFLFLLRVFGRGGEEGGGISTRPIW
jgi:hypothetical protein